MLRVVSSEVRALGFKAGSTTLPGEPVSLLSLGAVKPPSEGQEALVGKVGLTWKALGLAEVGHLPRQFTTVATITEL